jgi:hypothetical protein
VRAPVAALAEIDAENVRRGERVALRLLLVNFVQKISERVGYGALCSIY